MSDPDPILDEIRAANPLREHYDADLWEARILALDLARRAEVLADELRRVACAPPHVRENAMRHAKDAWYSNGDAMYGNPITGLFAVADDAGDELAEHFNAMLAFQKEDTP